MLVLEAIFAILLAGVVGAVLVLGLASGFLCLHIGKLAGPRALPAVGFICVAGSALIWLLLGTLAELAVPGMAAACLAAICSGSVFSFGAREMRAEVQYDRLIASWLPPVGLALFDKLDADKDNLLTVPELSRALAASAADPDSMLSIYLLVQNVYAVGHRLDRKTRKRLAAAERRGFFANREDLLFGISREDLQNYRQSVAEKYKRW